MCDPVSAAIAFVGLTTSAASFYMADQKPDMPDMPRMPEAPPPSKLSPEAKLPNLALGRQQNDKGKLQREKRKRRLSLAGLDLNDDDTELLGARNVREI